MSRLLFVCTANSNRSVTAEEMYSGRGMHEVKSCGIIATPGKTVSQELVDWADLIFVMEGEHRSYIVSNFSVEEDKIVVLDIPDRYPRGNPELKEILRERLLPYLG